MLQAYPSLCITVAPTIRFNNSQGSVNDPCFVQAWPMEGAARVGIRWETRYNCYVTESCHVGGPRTLCLPTSTAAMLVGIALNNFKSFRTNRFGFVLAAKARCGGFFSQPVLCLRVRAGTSLITNEPATAVLKRPMGAKPEPLRPTQPKLIPRRVISRPSRQRAPQVTQLNQRKRHRSFVKPNHDQAQQPLASLWQSRISVVLQRTTCACWSGCRVCDTPFLR